jgi:hypothetical protein
MGEHFVLFSGTKGQTEGLNPWGITSPIGNKVHPWWPTSPLGANFIPMGPTSPLAVKLKTGLRLHGTYVCTYTHVFMHLINLERADSVAKKVSRPRSTLDRKNGFSIFNYFQYLLYSANSDKLQFWKELFFSISFAEFRIRVTR